MKEMRRKLTYANVMSSLTMFLVLGGATAFAAVQLGKNSVGTVQLKAGAVTASKIQRRAVTSAKIADGSITGNDIAPGSITQSDLGANLLDKADIPPAPGRPAPPIDIQEFRAILRQGESRDVSPANIAPFSITATCESTGAAIVVASSAPGSIKSNGIEPPEPFDTVTLLSAELLPPSPGGEGLPSPNMKGQEGRFLASAQGVNITIREASIWVRDAFSATPCSFMGVVDRPL